jgi:hypothetical protein
MSHEEGTDDMGDLDDIVKRLKPGSRQLDARESTSRLAAVLAQEPRSAHRMPVMVASASLAVVLSTGAALAFRAAQNHDDPGQATGAEPPGSLLEGECQPRLRIDGIVYVGVGYLEDRPPTATRVGLAELAACDDEGSDGQRAHFPRSPEAAPAYRFQGQPAARVVGLDVPAGYEIYVAEDVPSAEAQDILEALQSSQ